MTVRERLKLGDPRLRQRAAVVAAFELEEPAFLQLITDLIDTMRAAQGVGIAAPQIGVLKQVCAIEVNGNQRYPTFPEVPLRLLVNPTVVPLVESHDFLTENEAISIYEGCLSVPQLRGRVTRPRRVRVRALDEKGRDIDEVWEGPLAAIVQHELDHLHGILFVDRADSTTLAVPDEYERHVVVDERVVDGVRGSLSKAPRAS